MCLTLPLSDPSAGGSWQTLLKTLFTPPASSRSHARAHTHSLCLGPQTLPKARPVCSLSSLSTDVSWTSPLPISARFSWKVGAGVPAGDFLQEREARAEKRREEPRTQSEGTWGCPLKVPGLAEV